MKFLPFLFALFVISCNNASEDSNVDVDTASSNTSNTDTTDFSDTITTNVKLPLPEGIYKTTLPQGIGHTIAFYDNNTYKLEEKKKGAKTSTMATGNWKPTSGIIYLYTDGMAAGRYQWKGDTLQYLKGTGSYSMQKQQSALDVEVWKNKKREGIEFFGIGNEPFWNIEIDEQKWIAFHLADWSKPMRFNAVKPTNKTDSILYSTKNDSATIRIVIYNTFCSDGMSDNIYDRTVKVVYNNQTYNGCGILYK